MAVAPVIEAPERRLPAHLSASQISLYNSCPESWRLKYLEGATRPAGVQLRVGSAVHAGAEAFYRSVRDGVDMYGLSRVDDAVQATRDYFAYTDAYSDEPVDSDAEDEAARLIKLYIQEAPYVMPVLIEESFTLALPDSDLPLVGRIDLTTTHGQLVDIKTSKASVSRPKPDWKLQARLYQAEFADLDFAWHVLVKNKTPKLLVNSDLELAYDPTMVRHTVEFASRVAAAIQHNYQTNPDGPWLQSGATHQYACSFCNGASLCAFGDAL